MSPAAVTRPMPTVLPRFVNHIAPSGPMVMPRGWSTLPRKSVSTPAGVMRPIHAMRANHRFPSGPVVILLLPSPLPDGGGKVVTTPAGVIRPVVPLFIVNQRLSSGPVVIPTG